MRSKYGGNIHPKSIVLVTDMNKIHFDPFSGSEEDKVIQKVIDDYKIQRLYLPPSSPDFNPLEAFFHTLKKRLRSREIRSTRELADEMDSGLIELSKESVEVYFDAAEGSKKCERRVKQ